MAAAGGIRGSNPGPGSAPGGAGDTSLLGSAKTWPLKRYGRFLPPRDGDDEGQNTSWKVFESNEESGPLVLTIVVSGHFFISQGRTVLVLNLQKFKSKGRTKDILEFFGRLVTIDCPSDCQGVLQHLRAASLTGIEIPSEEGFSLIDSHKWLKIVRRADCLLLQAQAKNECRMFRVQFGGSSKEEMLGHCCSCVHKLSEYVPVHGAEEQSQQLYHGLSQENQGMDPEHGPDESLQDSCTSLGERRSVAQLAQSVLRRRPKLPLAYRHVVWPAQELGPFIRLCLMDQHFPAFVEDVEKELQKLTEG